MTQNDFKKFVYRIRQLYPPLRKDDPQFLSDKEIFLVWWEIFEPLRNEFVELAVKDYVKSEKYAPTIADITTRYKEIEERNMNRYRDLVNDFEIAYGCMPLEFRGNLEEDKKLFMGAIKSQTYDECKDKSRSLKKFIYDNTMTCRATKTFKELVICWQNNV